MPILAIEETFGATAKIVRTKAYLEKTYSNLRFPAYAVAFRGDAAFSVNLNDNSLQHLEAYSTPFRIPRLEAKVSGYKLEGTNTKFVNVILWCKPRIIIRKEVK